MKKYILVFVSLLILLPATIYAKMSLNDINQKVSDRFENDITKLSAIMDEVKRRQGVTETRVAFGGVETPIERADYWINYAAEAIAFQRIQKYSDAQTLKGSLNVLRGKILRAKNEVGKVLDE